MADTEDKKEEMQTLKILGKRLLGVSMACSLGLVLLPLAELFAQSQQSQQPTESTPQSKAAEPTGGGSALLGQETNTEVPQTPGAPAPPTDYVIGPEDVLNIDVFNVPELSKLVARVANDGSITLPLLGQVRASGLTTEQLRNELQSDWGKTYLQDPQVAVFVQEFRARPVSVIGAVEKPGLYQLTAPRTLIEMLSMAGGLGNKLSAPAGKYVYVTRRGEFLDLQIVDGMRLVASDKVEIDLRRLFYSHEDALNIEIKPLDIISVSKADVVYVGGNGVRKPGAFPLEDRGSVTVLQALAMAEGLSPNAAKADARIIHTEPDGSRKMIPVDLKKVEKGKSRDLVLADNDILFVPDSSQKAVLKGGAATIVSTMSWLFIYGRI